MQLRLGPRLGSRTVAELSYRPSGVVSPDMGSTQAEILGAVSQAWSAGYDEIITSALESTDTPDFVAAGFEVIESLGILSLDVHRYRRPDATHPCSLLRRWQWRGALEVDARAFGPFWRIDRAALGEALHATEASTALKMTARRQILGYAIFGASDGIGYCQRIAVAPEAQRRGIATALMTCGIDWAVGRGTELVYVNTHATNFAAAQLYKQIGFVETGSQLQLLHIKRVGR